MVTMPTSVKVAARSADGGSAALNTDMSRKPMTSSHHGLRIAASTFASTSVSIETSARPPSPP